jgi:SAM-dependent methyltransferase
MKSHIEDVATDSLFYFKERENLNVMDIGSNDATLLNFINDYRKCHLVGVDPNIQDFSNKYDSKIAQFPNFFNDDTVDRISKIFPEGFDVIFSLAMLYDVPDLNRFANLIGKTLKKNGIWIIEVSYLFSMLEKNSIDTVCHEHISYFSLNALKFMAEQNNLKVIDFNLNDTNGGSVKLILSHKNSDYPECKKFEEELIEELGKIHTLPALFELMLEDLTFNIELALNFLNNLGQDAKIIAIGASTKGNTFLQIAKELSKKIQYVVEVNPNKFNKLTPGTYLPIISEELIFKTHEKLWAIVLPWHFKSNISDKFSPMILNDALELLFIIPKFVSINSKNYHTS